MKKKDTLKGENGSVLVVALMMLVLLTLLGISATTTSTIEMRVAGNERVYKDNFYAAEGAAMTCAQSLENEEDEDKLQALGFDWLHSVLPDVNNLFSDENWGTSQGNSVEAADADGRCMAGYNGIAPGSSLDIGSNTSLLHEFGIYGQSAKNNGECIIAAGFRKRF
jgi:type IV pilus assembly protein PilX